MPEPHGRTEMVCLYLTPAEKARFSALARREHRSLSQFIRLVLIERTPEPVGVDR